MLRASVILASAVRKGKGPRSRSPLVALSPGICSFGESQSTHLPSREGSLSFAALTRFLPLFIRQCGLYACAIARCTLYEYLLGEQKTKEDLESFKLGWNCNLGFGYSKYYYYKTIKGLRAIRT